MLQGFPLKIPLVRLTTRSNQCFFFFQTAWLLADLLGEFHNCDLIWTSVSSYDLPAMLVGPPADCFFEFSTDHIHVLFNLCLQPFTTSDHRSGNNTQSCENFLTTMTSNSSLSRTKYAFEKCLVEGRNNPPSPPSQILVPSLEEYAQSA